MTFIYYSCSIILSTTTVIGYGVVILKQKISTTEWKVMEVLWRGKEMPAARVVEELKDTGWSDRTIRTLLSRLVKKGVADYRAEGKSYIYFAVISKDECIKKENRDFINKIFNGSVKEFMASLIKNENLTKDEIKELRELLDKKGGE